MEKENLAKVACEALHLACPEPDLKDWEAMVDALRHPNKEVKNCISWKIYCPERCIYLCCGSIKTRRNRRACHCQH